MSWSWEKGSLLCDPTACSDCDALFRSVTAELGRYFASQGGRYSASRPKLTFNRGDLKLEIGLWSSRSNIPGEKITLEIVPSFFSSKLSRTGAAPKGYFFGHPAIFYERANDLPDQTVRFVRILEDDLERLSASRSQPALKYGNTCNVYNITTEEFIKIAAFIEDRILAFFPLLTDRRSLQDYLAVELAEREKLRNSPAMAAYLETLP